MTSSSKVALAASTVASWSSSFEPKCANSPLLLMPTASARCASDRPSRPSTVASRAASRRIAARLRSPSERRRRTVPAARGAADLTLMLDKLARPVVWCAYQERPIVLTAPTLTTAAQGATTVTTTETAAYAHQEGVDPDELSRHIAQMYR